MGAKHVRLVKRPVLMYCPAKDRIVPHYHEWIPGKPNEETWIDIAELPATHPYMVAFYRVYPAAAKMFFDDKQGMQQWLYGHYLQIANLATGKLSKRQKREMYRDIFL